jgi:hypothetical protein
MKKLLLCLILIAQNFIAQAETDLPKDVQKFIERREGCDHMRGEIPDPSESHRQAEVRREINRLCKGTDKELATLKKKYRARILIKQRLEEFEDGIEELDAEVPVKITRS